MDVGTLTGQIDLEDRLSGTLDQIDRRLKDFDKVAVSSMHGATTSMVGAGAAAVFLGSQLSNMVDKAISFGKNLFDSSIMAGARLETLGQVTGFLAEKSGYAAGYVDDLSRQIEKTGITAVASREAILGLLEKNIDLSKAAQLSAVAQNMAVVSGRSSTETYSTMVNILGTLNSRMIRSAGFTFTLEQATAAYSRETGKLASKLSLTEKRLAVTNAMIKEGENFAGLYALAMGTASKQVGSAERAWAQVGETLGTILLPITTMVIQAWYDLASQVKIVMVEIQKAVGPTIITVTGYIKTLVKEFTTFGAAAFPVVISAVKTFIAYLLDLNERFHFTDNLVKGAKAAWEVLKGAFELVKGAVLGVIAAWQSMPTWLQNITKSALESAAVLGAYSLVIGAVSTPFSILIEKIDLGINIIGNLSGAVLALTSIPWVKFINLATAAHAFLTGATAAQTVATVALTTAQTAQIATTGSLVVLTDAWGFAMVPATTGTVAATGALTGLRTAMMGVIATVVGTVGWPVILGVAAFAAAVVAIRAFTGSWDFILGPLKTAWNALDDIRVILWDVTKKAGEWASGFVFKFVEGLVARVKSAVSGLVEIWQLLERIAKAMPTPKPLEGPGVSGGQARPTNFDGGASNKQLADEIRAVDAAAEAAAKRIENLALEEKALADDTERAYVAISAQAKALDTVGNARLATGTLGSIAKVYDELILKGPIATDQMELLVNKIRAQQKLGGRDPKMASIADAYDISNMTNTFEEMTKNPQMAGGADIAGRLAEKILEIGKNSEFINPALQTLQEGFEQLEITMAAAAQQQLWDDQDNAAVDGMVEAIRRTAREYGNAATALTQMSDAGTLTKEAMATFIPGLEKQISLGLKLTEVEQYRYDQFKQTEKLTKLVNFNELARTKGINETLKVMRQMGLSEAEIANRLETTAAALAEVTAAERTRLSQMEELAQAQAVLNSTPYEEEIRKIKAVAQAKIDALVMTTDAAIAEAERIRNLEKVQLLNASLDTATIQAGSKKAAEEKIAEAERTLAFMKDSGDATTAAIAAQEQKVKDLRQALIDAGKSGAGAFNSIGEAVDEAAKSYGKFHDAQGNVITQIVRDRYSREQIAAAAKAIGTTPQEVLGMLQNIGQGTIEDIVKAGVAAREAMNQLLTTADANTMDRLETIIAEYTALGGGNLTPTHAAQQAAEQFQAKQNQQTQPTGQTQHSGIQASEASNSAKGFGGAVSVHMAPGAVQMNYPIMKDREAMSHLGDVVGEAVIQHVKSKGGANAWGISSRR